jgi:hypothetical protein
MRHENTSNRRLLKLLGGGLLGIGAIRPRVYPLSDLPQAIEIAATAGNYRDPALVSHLGIAAAFLLPSQQLFG